MVSTPPLTTEIPHGMFQPQQLTWKATAQPEEEGLLHLPGLSPALQEVVLVAALGQHLPMGKARLRGLGGKQLPLSQLLIKNKNKN